ncbi:MAG: hypothetical protein WCO50_04460, partial [Synechococcus sp. ELA619]
QSPRGGRGGGPDPPNPGRAGRDLPRRPLVAHGRRGAEEGPGPRPASRAQTSSPYNPYLVEMAIWCPGKSLVP